MELYNLNIIKPLLEKYGLWAKKRFGQNFLINKSALDSIVKTAEISKEDTIIEVGPGLGVLTQELAKSAKKVITIELDRTILPVLNETLNEFNNIEIINADALKFTPPKEEYKVVANIPYNITSHLINHFIQNENPPTSITLLVQKEVADKLCTLEPDMSVLSLQVALFGDARKIKTVTSGSFFPAPKVDSAIIHINVRKENSPDYIEKEKALKILALAKKAFSQKRKKLSNTLDLEKTHPFANLRPENLSVKDWLTMI